MILSNRLQYSYQGQIVYQWQENLSTITIYIPTPNNLPTNIKLAKLFDIKIQPKMLQIGLKGNPPYLKHQLKGIVDVQQSLWYIFDKDQKQTNNSNQQIKNKKKQLIIELQKAQKGIQWGSVFVGHQKLNPLQQQQLKKKLLLERFGQENPGFDFSQASFNGQVPLARQFMGGVKY